MITYIKRSKPNYNIDLRYLKAMFKKFNHDEHVNGEKMTYFGYLNLIKPHFDSKIANELLARDTVTSCN